MSKNILIAILTLLLAVSITTSVSAEEMSREMPRLFNSEQELKDWLEPYAIHRGQDCDDAALDLFYEALRDGYILWAAPVWKGKVMDEKVMPTGLTVKRHFGSWTWIGNDIYYVDLSLKAPHYVKLKYTWLD